MLIHSFIMIPRKSLGGVKYINVAASAFDNEQDLKEKCIGESRRA